MPDVCVTHPWLKKTFCVFTSLLNVCKWKLTATLCTSKFMSVVRLQLQTPQHQKERKKEIRNMKDKREEEKKWEADQQKQTDTDTERQIESESEREKQSKRSTESSCPNSWPARLMSQWNKTQHMSKHEETGQLGGRKTHIHKYTCWYETTGVLERTCAPHTLIKECQYTAETFNCTEKVYNTHARHTYTHFQWPSTARSVL